MLQLSPVPPQLTPHEALQAEKLLKYAAMHSRPPLSSDNELLECLYYPLRTTNLPSFQYEMLVWDTDKLNVFSEENPPKLTSLRGRLDHPPLTKYKRLDAYTVIAVMAFGDEGAIFTNEISQTTWELIGVVGVKDLRRQLDLGRHSLVDYKEIERSFERKEEETKTKLEEAQQQSDSSDDYWAKYDVETPEEAEQATEMDEETYFNRHCEQSPQLDARKVRETAVQALADLGDLYRDCGTDASIAIQDILSIALRSVPMPVEAPYVAHRHAMRTITWVKDSSTAFQDEVTAAIDIITRRASTRDD